MAVFRYRFANGEVSEVEVSQELHDVLIGLDRLERNNDQTERRRHVSLDRLMREWDAQFADDLVLEEQVEMLLDIERLQRAVAALPPKHRELLRLVFREGRSVSSVAREERVHESSIRERLARIYKNLKKSL